MSTRIDTQGSDLGLLSINYQLSTINQFPMSPTVSLIRATSYEALQLRESVEAVLAPLGGIGAFVKTGDRVLLKPNLLTGSRPTKECVTRPELVRCVAELVIEAGGKPFFGDSPAFGSAMRGES